MPETHEVKCARCDCALQGPANPKPEDRFSCPTCGEGDTHNAVLREVGEYAKEQTVIFLNNKVRDVARGSKLIKFSSDFRPKGGHRFVIDLDLH